MLDVKFSWKLNVKLSILKNSRISLEFLMLDIFLFFRSLSSGPYCNFLHENVLSYSHVLFWSVLGLLLSLIILEIFLNCSWIVNFFDLNFLHSETNALIFLINSKLSNLLIFFVHQVLVYSTNFSVQFWLKNLIL